MKKLTKKEELYYKRLLMRMFRPYYLSKGHWTKQYHYWVEDNGSSLSLWRSDFLPCRLHNRGIDRLITIPTAPDRKPGSLWMFDEQ